MQFELRHLFHFVSAAAAYFAVERLTGPVLPMLSVGLVAVGVAIMLLRIENMLAGAVLGSLLSIALVICLMPFWHSDAMGAAMVCLGYPLAGYFVGLVCAADRSFRSAI